MYTLSRRGGWGDFRLRSDKQPLTVPPTHLTLSRRQRNARRNATARLVRFMDMWKTGIDLPHVAIMVALAAPLPILEQVATPRCNSAYFHVSVSL